MLYSHEFCVYHRFCLCKFITKEPSIFQADNRDWFHWINIAYPIDVILQWLPSFTRTTLIKFANSICKTALYSATVYSQSHWVNIIPVGFAQLYQFWPHSETWNSYPDNFFTCLSIKDFKWNSGFPVDSAVACLIMYLYTGALVAQVAVTHVRRVFVFAYCV